MTDGRPALSCITNILPRFRRTYSSSDTTAGASAFSCNCTSRVLSPGAPDYPGRLGGKVDADPLPPAPGVDARRRRRRVGQACRVQADDRVVEAGVAPVTSMVFPTYASISSCVAVLYGAGRAFLAEKFILAVSLSAPPGPHVAPNPSRITLATTLAVQDPRSKPPSVGLRRRMPSSSRIWSPERRRLARTLAVVPALAVPPPASAAASHARCSWRTRPCRPSCPGSSPACGAWPPSACPATCRAARFSTSRTTAIC